MNQDQRYIFPPIGEVLEEQRRLEEWEERLEWKRRKRRPWKAGKEVIFPKVMPLASVTIDE